MIKKSKSKFVYYSKKIKYILLYKIIKYYKNIKSDLDYTRIVRTLVSV